MDRQPSASPVPSLTLDAPEPDFSALDLILQTAGGYCVSRALHVAAELGLADHVRDVATPVGQIAEAVGADTDALRRLFGLLSAHGIFRTVGDQIVHNPASRLLATDHPQSARDLARMFGLPIFWQSFEALDHSVRTGRPAVERSHPEGIWAWLAQRPDASAIFNGAMAGKAVGQVAGIVAAYDFSRFGTIADIGGGRGHLLQAILANWPSARAILFDQPHVIAEVEDLASDRFSLRGGDFFHDPLPAADAYLLMEVIHDWADPEAKRILAAVRQAAPVGARLLIIEQLMPDTPGPHWAKMLDLHMMTHFAARQRSAEEYDALAGCCGFGRVGSIDTPAGISILDYEAV